MLIVRLMIFVAVIVNTLMKQSENFGLCED